MSDVRRSLVHIDEVLADVAPRLRPAVRQLHTWSGGFAEATSDAPPSSKIPPHRPDTAVDPDPDPPVLLGPDGVRLQFGVTRQTIKVKLTSVERDVERGPDEARRTLGRIHSIVYTLTLEADRMSRISRSMSIDPPSVRLEDRIEFVRWHVTECLTHLPPKSVTGRVENARRLVDSLARIVDAHQPATTPRKWEGQCAWHRRAGLFAMVDENYRKQEACGWCGKWRAEFGQPPPAAIVKMHDKGQHKDARRPSVLRKYGVKVKR